MKRLTWIGLVTLSMFVVSGRVYAAESNEAPGKASTAETSKPAESGSSGTPDLNFDDLLPPSTTTSSDTPAVPLGPPVDQNAVKTRRLMLTLHQSVGIALSLGMAGSMVTGQLNYNDKFLHDKERNSGRYELAHQAFVYPTLGLAAVTAGLALFAPVPIEKKSHGFDRMTLHKVGQFTAFAGWAAQLGLGLYTASREGYANQQGLATAHLAVGYVTLAGILMGLGAIVF